MTKTEMGSQVLRAWSPPRLEFRGTVGEILNSGGGKLSLAGSDMGEMRCEKPHVSLCD